MNLETRVMDFMFNTGTTLLWVQLEVLVLDSTNPYHCSSWNGNWSWLGYKALHFYL